MAGSTPSSPSCKIVVDDLRSHMVTFSPSMWGDTFTSYSVDEQLQEQYAEAVETLKIEVRKLLINDQGIRMPIDKLILIDTLGRLGVAYHFQKEIGEQLELIFKHHTTDSQHGDLFGVATEFRLLRQHSYQVSSGVFDQFKDKDNKFNEAISCDVEGLLSLYETAQVRIHGEKILDEAVAFTVQNLNRMLPQLQSPLKDKLTRTLAQSQHRGVLIVEACYHYINFYEKDYKKDELLLKFAKLNFIVLRNMYRKELCEISRWWNEFDLKSKIPYSRDRLVECYFWGVSMHFEPQYAFVRSTIAKCMQLVTFLDDTYDNFATVEEGQLFTEILERWDIGEIDPLPDYMKIIYKFILSTYQDFEREASEYGKTYIMPYAIESVKQIGRAYMKELLWFNGRQTPDFDEYFANTVITSCIYIMFIPCFIGMSSTSLECVDWLVSGPNILVGTAKMGRHVENLGSCEWENRDGQMVTAIDYYMKKHKLSKEETLVKFIEQADDGWKDLNTEMFNVPSWVPKDIFKMFPNYARNAEITYKNCEDGYTHPEKFLASQIAALLIDPIVF